MAKPLLPFWGVTGTKTEPPAGKKNAGFKAGKPESAQYFNWFADLVWKWLRGVQGDYADIVVGSAGEVTSGDADNTVGDFVVAIANGDTVRFLAGTHALTRNEDITETDVTLLFESDAILDDGTNRTFTVSGARARIGPGRFTGFTFGDIILSGAGSILIGIDLDMRIVAASNGALVLTSGTAAGLNMAGYAPFPTGFITGFLPSHDTDTVNDMAITAGQCRDAADTKNVISTITYAKQLDATWATGDDAGGLFSGATAYADGVSYHGCLIENDTTGVLEWGFDSDPAGANTPAGYSFMRRMFSILATAGPAIINGSWREKSGGALDNLLLVPIQDWNTTNPGTSAVTPAVSVPDGIQLEANLSVTMKDDTPINAVLLLTSLDQTDTLPTNVLFDIFTRAAGEISTVAKLIRTSTGALVRYRVQVSDGSLTIYGLTHGFVDDRR